MKSTHSKVERIGLADVTSAIDKAEEGFRSCWTTLACLKQHSSELSAQTLLEFQPTLAETLYDLEQIYKKVIQRRDFLVNSRGQRSSKALSHGLRLLDKYATGLKQAMQIGRALGDAFAWVFYCSSPEMLRKHISHPRTGHFPSGIGGKGEVEFIRHARAEKHFLLHHSITSFLRIGDLSFIDLPKRAVTGLGELKSHEFQPGQVDVMLHAVSTDRANLPRIFVIPGRLEESSKSAHLHNTPEFKKRLKKQISGMGSALSFKAPERRENLLGAYYTTELSNVAQQIATSKVAYAQIGRGGIIAGIRPFRSRTIAGRLFTEQNGQGIVAHLKTLPQLLSGVSDRQSSENSLLFGELTTQFAWGRLPLFWMPVDLDFLEKVYFGEVLLFSFYNPVHLMQDLRQAGFEVRIEKPPYPTVKKLFKKAILEVENFEFFVTAIYLYLMREEKIIELIVRLAKEADAQGVPTRITLNMVPMM